MQPTLPASAFTFIDRTAARSADGLIRAYQRWLSPLKGRDRGCAHRVRYGGDSCSQHVRRLLAEGGAVSAVVPGALQRFAACREAASAVDAMHPGRRRHRGQCCIVIPCGTTKTMRV